MNRQRALDLIGEAATHIPDEVRAATDDGHQWNVAPGLLHLVQSAGDV